MSKLFWNTLKLSPILLSASLVLANRSQAAETKVAELVPTQAAVQVAQLPAEDASSAPVQNTDSETAAPETSVSELSDEPSADELAQVTSVSQLSDVQPTDWAFQALQSLVERYGCIVGYPDSTYRGNRALTRYEFAAGLNACLDRVNELIATATADIVTREDLATLQRLQEEFSAELATLRGRVDALEARTAELEANQFSTTTKLTGEVIVAISDVFGDEAAERSTATGSAAPDADRGDLDVNTVLADRVRLNFDTSFSGTDLLRTRVQARNVTPFTRTGVAGDPGDTGTAMTRLGFDGDEGNDVILDDFFYRFNVGEIANVKIDFDNAEYNDNVFTFNPLFESSGRGAISRFGRFNPIYRSGDGAGITVNFNPQGSIGLSVGYLATNANNPDEGAGLFNGEYAALGQLTFRPTDSINIGLTYVHAYETPGVNNVTGGTGSNFANNPFNGAATSSNQYGVQASFKFGKLTLSGWGGYTTAIAEDGDITGVNTGDVAESVTWAATLGVQDLVKEGSVLGVIFGQPPRVIDNDFATGNAREDDDGTTYHLEALYRFPLTDNIEITPGVVVLFNPEHNEDNDNIYVGTIRTTFRF